MKTFPVLWSKDEKGTIRFWLISVTNNNIHVEFGIYQGKSIYKIIEIGDINKAIKEAKSRYKEKVNDGYVPFDEGVDVDRCIAKLSNNKIDIYK